MSQMLRIIYILLCNMFMIILCFYSCSRLIEWTKKRFLNSIFLLYEQVRFITRLFEIPLILHAFLYKISCIEGSKKVSKIIAGILPLLPVSFLLGKESK